MNRAEIAIQDAIKALDFITTYPVKSAEVISEQLAKYGVKEGSVEAVIHYIVGHKTQFNRVLNLMLQSMADNKLTIEEAKVLANLIWVEFGSKLDPSAVWYLTGQMGFSFEASETKMFKFAKTIQDLI